MLNITMDSFPKSVCGANSFEERVSSSVNNLIINFTVRRLLESSSFGFICLILHRDCSFGKYLGNTVYL